MSELYYGNAIFRIFHNYSFISIKNSGDLCFMMENMTMFVHVCQYSKAVNMIIWTAFLIHLNCKLSSIM